MLEQVAERKHGLLKVRVAHALPDVCAHVSVDVQLAALGCLKAGQRGHGLGDGGGVEERAFRGAGLAASRACCAGKDNTWTTTAADTAGADPLATSSRMVSDAAAVASARAAIGEELDPRRALRWRFM